MLCILSGLTRPVPLLLLGIRDGELAQQCQLLSPCCMLHNQFPAQLSTRAAKNWWLKSIREYATVAHAIVHLLFENM